MSKEVKLSQTYTAHDKVFDTITLREPTFSELFIDGLGRPFDFQPTPSGVARITYPEVVDRYAQTLITEPGYECITAISAVDALRLEAAIVDFFRERTE